MPVNIWEIISLFIFLAGFVIGLGAVTVIDSLGFVARRSSYWTETTIRAHKITKPLIWLGIALVVVGFTLFYWPNNFTGLAAYQAIIFLVLIINGCFLSFYVSPRLISQERQGKSQELLAPRLQLAIAISFIFSFLGWWSALFILAQYLLT